MACPGVYLAALQMAQPVQAEFLDGKAPHDRSVDHGAAERSVGLVPVPGQVAHEATGEAVARPGRIVWLFKRKCWDTENATLVHHHRASFRTSTTCCAQPSTFSRWVRRRWL